MEYRIGETFQWGDDLLKTVADTDECSGCEQCYFFMMRIVGTWIA